MVMSTTADYELKTRTQTSRPGNKARVRNGVLVGLRNGVLVGLRNGVLVGLRNDVLVRLRNGVLAGSLGQDVLAERSNGREAS